MTIQVTIEPSTYVLGTTDGESYHINPVRDACYCSACTTGKFGDKH